MPEKLSLTRIGLLWLAGAGLRITILAVPPIIPLIRADLRLSATEIGLLASFPIALFALAALPGSLLVARLGTLPTLVGGLLVAALGSGLRGLSQSAGALYATTIVMGLGIAIMQPAMPAIVRQWLPTRIGFGTAVYTNGLLVSEVLPVFLTIPVILPLLGGEWRQSLVVWSVPLAITACLMMVLGPRPGGSRAAVAPHPYRWWPNWKNRLIWQLGILFGSINSIYFCTNTFLPDYLTSVGRPDLISGALTALNLAQIPTSLLLLAIVRRVERRAWPFALTGLLGLIGLLGLVSTVGGWTIVWTSVIGVAGSVSLILALTLPPLLSPSVDVARTSAAMFSISYTGAVAVALLCGAAADLSGTPRLAFGPIALCAVAQIVSALALRLTRDLR